MYLSQIFYALAIIALALFALSVIVVTIVKILHYINGKPIFTPKKLSRKLLGAEMGAAILLFVLGFISYLIRTYI